MHSISVWFCKQKPDNTRLEQDVRSKGLLINLVDFFFFNSHKRRVCVFILASVMCAVCCIFFTGVYHYLLRICNEVVQRGPVICIE